MNINGDIITKVHDINVDIVKTFIMSRIDQKKAKNPING